MMKAERFIIPWLGLLALSASAQSDSTNAGSASEYFNKASRQYVKEDKGSAMRRARMAPPSLTRS